MQVRHKVTKKVFNAERHANGMVTLSDAKKSGIIHEKELGELFEIIETQPTTP